MIFDISAENRINKVDYQEFLDTLIVSPADFNIGGVRVNGSSLDYSDVSEESLKLAGIAYIKISCQNKAKIDCADGLKDIKGADKPKYIERLNALAADYSGHTIDMSQFVGKPSWNFEKGLTADPLKKAKSLVGKMTKDEAKELQDYMDSLEGKVIKVTEI